MTTKIETKIETEIAVAKELTEHEIENAIATIWMNFRDNPGSLNSEIQRKFIRKTIDSVVAHISSRLEKAIYDMPKLKAANTTLRKQLANAEMVLGETEAALENAKAKLKVFEEAKKKSAKKKKAKKKAAEPVKETPGVTPEVAHEAAVPTHPMAL